jgi:hypothetical protein
MRPVSSRSVSLGPSVVLALSFAALGGVASLAACSSNNQVSAGANEAGAPVDLDVDTTGPCTSVGGTCEAYSSGCPILQQDPTLCGNVVLVCCLPPGGEIIPVHDSGATGDGGDDAGPMNVPDTGTPPPPPDSGSTNPPDSGSTNPPPDSGSTNPPPDSGSSNPPDASTPKDASED